MRITPLDIRKQEFRKTMRGLDTDEVYAFLGTVADEYEAVLSDNKRLREHIVQLEERLKEFKSMETNLRNTLMTAEKITAEAKENARKEADLIIRGAEVEASQSSEAIRAHTQQLRREILELKKHKDNYISRLKTLLDSHRNVIDGFEEDFAEVDREIELIGKKVEEDVKTPPPASRMSRERIEEDFAHEEPEDKVTWGDDEPRKDVERPTVPRPGEWERQNPEKRGVAPEEGAGQEEETAASTQLDFGPVGVVSDEDVMASAKATEDESDGEYHDDRENMTKQELEGEALARDVVAHNIEERMYPDSHLNGDGPTAPPAATDDWKSYEVKESKQDWSSYEVPRKDAPAAPRPPVQPAPQKVDEPAADKAPTDNEVEEALSGLTEMGSGKPSPGAKKTDQPAAPKAKAPPAKAAPAQPAADSTDETAEEISDEDRKWSMDELRKNLTNMDRDS
jgi:cell division initiation protein